MEEAGMKIIPQPNCLLGPPLPEAKEGLPNKKTVSNQFTSNYFILVPRFSEMHCSDSKKHLILYVKFTLLLQSALARFNRQEAFNGADFT